MREPILQIDQACAEHQDADGSKQTVLHDVSLEGRPGEVLTLIGPSGCGKSTLLRLCNRLREVSSGGVRYQGADIRSLAPTALRREVALMAQRPFLFDGAVRDNLAAPARINQLDPVDLSSPEVQSLLELCHVETNWLDRAGAKLSIGQQQRVCLARALMNHCKVLLLDEPTSALDRPTAMELAQTFRDLATQRNLLVVLVTHDLLVAEQCADRVAVMLEGRVAEQGLVEQVLHAPKSQAVRQFVATPQKRDRSQEGKS